MKIDDFKNLIESSKMQISVIENQQAVIALETEKCNIYSEIFNPTEDHNYTIFEKMTTNSDEIVKKIICIFDNEQLDVPSFQFRKMLIALDESNIDAEILLLSEEGWISRKLENTFAS